MVGMMQLFCKQKEAGLGQGSLPVALDPDSSTCPLGGS